MVGGIKLQSGQRLPPLRSYMDDITSILQTAACTTRLLKRLDELVSWARMKIKPSKSRSLSLRKRFRNENTIFVAGGEQIPLLVTQPIQSLGRQYTAELSDKQMGKAIQKQLSDGLARIHRSQLPGKYKVSSGGTSCSCLYNGLGYKQGKTRLVQELRESTDQLVRCADAQVRTGQKWKAQVEVDQAISRLQHLDVVGRVQAGRTGLGWGEAPQFWSKANRKERKEMVVSEVTKMEEERYKIKAVSQGCQGGWTTWEGIVSRPISWSDLWKIPKPDSVFSSDQPMTFFLVPATFTSGLAMRSAAHSAMQASDTGC
ncbi:hypothetical protein AAFF_G00037200 [Aldrovandia affinis]|uniref:Reverse transcriptase domain-containing protein n=1 Tax=Aldrovandia affinis TaxID=143900 RepID=A0AAD7T554_9TELE|nr:hypothetical protein AAFF_G00037200 [Aldrovandia affinis]